MKKRLVPSLHDGEIGDNESFADEELMKALN
jgi:hypothetical protein